SPDGYLRSKVRDQSLTCGQQSFARFGPEDLGGSERCARNHCQERSTGCTIAGYRRFVTPDV
ncbi:hypothetical protein MTR72_37315, partial [Bradyrhizobium sp. ISRA442]|uniref:hypothetical protein n=1 Tax=Bradyrhizobium sp. ISRA442 TaxID=2866197 RepID=UPI00311AFF33